jgi:nucleoid-associated protein YgaU
VPIDIKGALSKKYGPLTGGAWAAIAGLGAFLLIKHAQASKNGTSGDQAGGQGLPDYNFNTDYSTTNPSQETGPYGATSFADPAYFGAGPMSGYAAGAMGYSGGDTFINIDGSTGGGNYGGPPSGNQGWQGAGGGTPHGQRTQTGMHNQTYQVQKGDNLKSISKKLYGDSDGDQAIQSANGNVLRGGKGGRVQAGISLNIPPAPHSGPPAPGGPSGNGVGGGSRGASGYGGAGVSNSSRAKRGNKSQYPPVGAPPATTNTAA